MNNRMHHVQFVHEAIHERLVNWSKWLRTARGGVNSSPMFRHYKAPRYRNATEDDIRVPVDPLDAITLEKVVGQLSERHRDALRWYYVYSSAGVSPFKVCRLLAVTHDGLADLVHDGRTMVKNRVDRSGTHGRIPSKFESAPAAPVSRCEAGVPVKEVLEVD